MKNIRLKLELPRFCQRKVEENDHQIGKSPPSGWERRQEVANLWLMAIFPDSTNHAY